MTGKIDTLLELFSSYIPFKHLYYKAFYKGIAGRIKKRVSSETTKESVVDLILKVITIPFDNLRYVSDDEKREIIEAADLALSDTFDYLGSGACILDPIPWSTDFKVGFEWPAGRYYKDYVQVDLHNNADVKVPRELSRCHFLLHLAIAYRITGRREYAEKVIGTICDWIYHNPFLQSINWCCSMDVAIRAVNWMWALAILKGYPIEERESSLIKTSLYEHGWYIYRNPEGSVFSYNGNHYMSDIVGLIHLGILFKKDVEGSKWYKFSKKELFREIRLQVLPSGMQYENSTHYHRLVLELLLPTLNVLKNDHCTVPPDILTRAESMFNFVYDILPQNGVMPIIGDQDNGRCLPFGVDDINDMSYLMSLSATLFHNGKHKSRGNGYNIYCALLGRPDSYNDYTGLPEGCSAVPQSILIKDAGFAVLQNKDWHIVFNTDNQGLYRDKNNGCGHTHLDWLSFVLNYKGAQIIVDPGTYVYSSDYKTRNLYRSSHMHNTLIIDDKDQSVIPEYELWNLPRKGKTTIEKYSLDGEVQSICCSHNAYTSEGCESLIHSRELNLFDDRIEINDIVCPDVLKHKMNIFYHFNPETKLENKGDEIIISHGKQILAMSFASDSRYDIFIEPYKLSDSYGTERDAIQVNVSIVDCAELNFKTIIKEA